MGETNETHGEITEALPPEPPPQRSHRVRDWTLGIVGALVLLGLGVLIGVASHPTKTITHTRVVVSASPVAGPTITVTTQAPPPPAGTLVGKWSGTGNQNTPAFNVPASGNFVVSWSYYGNVDPSIGGATNFAITDTNSGSTALGLPNDIATAGSGSTEVTGASGVESFNVQATGNWTIKVVSAS